MTRQERGAVVVRVYFAAVTAAVVVCLAISGCTKPAVGPGNEVPGVDAPSADMAPGGDEPQVEEPEGQAAAEAGTPESEPAAQQAAPVERPPAPRTREVEETSAQPPAPSRAGETQRATPVEDAPPGGPDERRAVREGPQGLAGEGAGFRERRGGRRGQRLFEQYDSNGDELLTREELPEELADRVMRADADEDGRVSKDELMQFRPRARGERRGRASGRQEAENGR
ncbi:MAG: hypothetical protein U9R79_02510 [Armatimonadota bacterium]|nr:hypothetical protein [Armatimonadota bacterium]